MSLVILKNYDYFENMETISTHGAKKMIISRYWNYFLDAWVRVHSFLEK